jgi:hypothetical protein
VSTGGQNGDNIFVSGDYVTLATIAPKSVTLPVGLVDELHRARDKLAALEAAGVENWEGYEEAVKDL